MKTHAGSTYPGLHHLARIDARAASQNAQASAARLEATQFERRFGDRTTLKA